ncbi:MAG: UDP-2,3-diacylglucosamine diphosphatase, partial [Sedimenticola sp.]
MDVNQQTVADYMREHDVRVMIHGHTHRPGIHDFRLDGETARRYVLDQWHRDRGEYLRVTEDRIMPETIGA